MACDRSAARRTGRHGLTLATRDLRSGTSERRPGLGGTRHARALHDSQRAGTAHRGVARRSMTVIDLREGFPDLPASAEAWLGELQGPTAVRVPGRDGARLRVVSGLLHGNEPSGLRAIFELL